MANKLLAATLALALTLTITTKAEESGDKATEQAESDTLVIDKTGLLIISANFSELEAEYGEDADVVADDGNWYEYLTREY